jgi:hypothetical protein
MPAIEGGYGNPIAAVASWPTFQKGRGRIRGLLAQYMAGAAPILPRPLGLWA